MWARIVITHCIYLTGLVVRMKGGRECCGRCLSCEVTVTCQSSLCRWGDRKLPSDINRMPKERDRHASGQTVWPGWRGGAAMGSQRTGCSMPFLGWGLLQSSGQSSAYFVTLGDREKTSSILRRMLAEGIKERSVCPAWARDMDFISSTSGKKTTNKQTKAKPTKQKSSSWLKVLNEEQCSVDVSTVCF